MKNNAFRRLMSFDFSQSKAPAEQGVLPLAGSHNALNTAAHYKSDFSRSATAYIQ